MWIHDHTHLHEGKKSNASYSSSSVSTQHKRNCRERKGSRSQFVGGTWSFDLQVFPVPLLLRAWQAPGENPKGLVLEERGIRHAGKSKPLQFSLAPVLPSEYFWNLLRIYSHVYTTFNSFAFLFKILLFIIIITCVSASVKWGSQKNFWESSSLLPPWSQGLNSEHQVCTSIAFTHGAILKALLCSWAPEHFSAISLEFVCVSVCVIQTGLELLILLPPPHHRWDHSRVPQYHTVPLTVTSNYHSLLNLCLFLTIQRTAANCLLLTIRSAWTPDWSAFTKGCEKTSFLRLSQAGHCLTHLGSHWLLTPLPHWKCYFLHPLELFGLCGSYENCSVFRNSTSRPRTRWKSKLQTSPPLWWHYFTFPTFFSSLSKSKAPEP